MGIPSVPIVAAEAAYMFQANAVLNSLRDSECPPEERGRQVTRYLAAISIVASQTGESREELFTDGIRLVAMVADRKNIADIFDSEQEPESIFQMDIATKRLLGSGIFIKEIPSNKPIDPEKIVWDILSKY